MHESPTHPSSSPGAATPRSGLIDWNQIDEPGCYLHLPSGLLARVFDLREAPARDGAVPFGGAAVRLSSDPNTPLELLREIAMKNALPVAF